MKVKISDYFTHEGLGVLFIMLPLLSKWILPPGIETKLYIEPLKLFNLYLPNILLILAPFHFKKSRMIKFRIVFWIWFVIEIFVLSFSDTPNVLINICGNTFLFGSLYLGLFHKLSDFQVALISPLCLLGCLIIAIQLIVLSTGFVAYDLGDVGREFAGVFRVYTTAGESNASGDIVGLCMLFLLLTLKNNKVKIIVTIISTIAIFFTVSRSAIAMIAIPFIYLWFRYFRKKMKYNFIFIVIVAIMAFIGVFNPIIERSNSKQTDGDITSGRDVLVEDVLKNVHREHAELWGLGIGNVYQSTEVAYSKVKMPYPGAPHNSYVLIYAEQGLIGVILFAFLLLAFFRRGYRKNLDACVFLFILYLTIYNTETVISVNSDCVYLSTLFMLLINTESPFKVIESNKKQFTS